jgi:FKBP-type peptidyl-prolyl cis-trans isomerase
MVALRAVVLHACVVATVGLRLTAAPHAPLKPAQRASSLRPALPALAASTISLPAVADEAWDALWYELNHEPPISLNPFHINAVGYLIIGLYASYLGWSLFRPPSAAEEAWAAEQEGLATEAAAAAPAFLAEAAEAEGAKVLPSGLIFQELIAGSGDAPTADHEVTVHYEGTLADGNTFDSSLDRGEPSTFKVGQVIKGWQEGLQLMKPGGKAVLTIPSELAYGPQPVGKIPGNSALRFEVELLEMELKKGLFG